MDIRVGTHKEFEIHKQQTGEYYSPEQYTSPYFQRFLAQNDAIRSALAAKMEELGLSIAQLDIRLNLDSHNDLFLIVMDHTTRRIYHQIDRHQDNNLR